MRKYEAMFILKPDLSEEEKKSVTEQITEAITKNNGKVASAAVWAEKKKMCFKIKRYLEGTYYLVNFDCAPAGIAVINHAYRLNENILRVLITNIDQ